MTFKGIIYNDHNKNLESSDISLGEKWGCIRDTVVARWTADQQIERLILHQVYDS